MEVVVAQENLMTRAVLKVSISSFTVLVMFFPQLFVFLRVLSLSSISGALFLSFHVINTTSLSLSLTLSLCFSLHPGRFATRRSSTFAWTSKSKSTPCGPSLSAAPQPSRHVTRKDTCSSRCASQVREEILSISIRIHFFLLFL